METAAFRPSGFDVTVCCLPLIRTDLCRALERKHHKPWHRIAGSMSPAVRGIVERRLLVNYRVDLGRLDAILSKPFRGREVGESGMGIGSICLTRVENARPRFAPGFLGIPVETATHRVYARVEGGGEHCVYVPRRDVSSGFHAFVMGSLLPMEFDRGEFRTEERGIERLIQVDGGNEVVGVLFQETERDEVKEDSVFYSLESASVFLCEGGVEYGMSGDVYSGIETCLQENDLKPVEVKDEQSSYFGKMGGEFDSAFRMEEVEHVWEPRRSSTG